MALAEQKRRLPSEDLEALWVSQKTKQRVRNIANLRRLKLNQLAEQVWTEWLERQPEDKIFELLEFDPTAARRQHPIPDNA